MLFSLSIPSSVARHQIGSFGIVHPEVLKEYELDFPTSALEMNIEPLM